MGLFTRLVTLPLAPLEGVAWVAQKLQEQAYDELYGFESIRRQLAELQAMLDAGQITEDEYIATEEDLLDRLDEAAMGPNREVSSEPR